jgi:hypothetical protein
MADIAFISAGAVAFALMALFMWAIEILVRQDDHKGSGR